MQSTKVHQGQIGYVTGAATITVSKSGTASAVLLVRPAGFIGNFVLMSLIMSGGAAGSTFTLAYGGTTKMLMAATTTNVVLTHLFWMFNINSADLVLTMSGANANATLHGYWD